MARRGVLESSSESAQRRRRVEMEQRAVEMETEAMRPRMTTGESLDRTRDGLVSLKAYRGRTYSRVYKSLGAASC